MTIDQLKRHVDRRLRGKADKADVHRLERRMEARFAMVEVRFGKVDARFAAIEGRLTGVDARLASHDRRFDSIDDKLNAILKILQGHYDQHEKALGDHEYRLRDLERRSPTDVH